MRGAGGCSTGGHFSVASKAREEGFRGRYKGQGKVAAIVIGDPQCVSLLSPVVDVPSPTSSVPIFSLD